MRLTRKLSIRTPLRGWQVSKTCSVRHSLTSKCQFRCQLYGDTEMAKDSTGYIGKDKNGKWFARVTLTGTNGKRRNIARRAASKPEARQLLKTILRQIE